MRIYFFNDRSAYTRFFNFYHCDNQIKHWQFSLGFWKGVPGFYNHKRSYTENFDIFNEKDVTCDACNTMILTLEEMFTFISIYKLSGEVGLNNYLLSAGFTDRSIT